MSDWGALFAPGVAINEKPPSSTSGMVGAGGDSMLCFAMFEFASFASFVGLYFRRDYRLLIGASSTTYSWDDIRCHDG